MLDTSRCLGKLTGSVLSQIKLGVKGEWERGRKGEKGKNRRGEGGNEEESLNLKRKKNPGWLWVIEKGYDEEMLGTCKERGRVKVGG